MTESAKTPIRRKSVYYLLLLSAVSAVSMLDRVIVNTLAQQIKADLGLTDTQIGLLTGSAFAVFYAIASFPIARIADRRPRTRMLCLMILAWSCMTMTGGLAQSFVALCLARIGVGIGEAGVSPAAQSLIADLFSPARLATAMAIFVGGASIGGMTGSIIGGLLGQHFGWRITMLLAGAAGLPLAALIALTMKEPQRGKFSALPAGETTIQPGIVSTLKQLWARRTYRYVVIASCLSNFSIFGLAAFTIAYLQRAFGVTLVQASSSYGLVVGISGFIGVLTGGALTDRLARRDPRLKLWFPGLALIACTPIYMLAFSQSSMSGLIGFAALAAFMVPMYMGASFAVAQIAVPPSIRASASSVLMLSATLVGLGLGPLTTGMVSDHVAGSAFGSGSAKLCAQAVMDPVCNAALTHGLRTAILGVVSCFALAGICLLIAGFYADLNVERPNAAREPSADRGNISGSDTALTKALS